jgi:hypothetical protein
LGRPSGRTELLQRPSCLSGWHRKEGSGPPSDDSDMGFRMTPHRVQFAYRKRKRPTTYYCSVFRLGNSGTSAGRSLISITKSPQGTAPSKIGGQRSATGYTTNRGGSLTPSCARQATLSRRTAARGSSRTSGGNIGR